MLLLFPKKSVLTNKLMQINAVIVVAKKKKIISMDRVLDDSSSSGTTHTHTHSLDTVLCWCIYYDILYNVHYIICNIYSCAHDLWGEIPIK